MKLATVKTKHAIEIHLRRHRQLTKRAKQVKALPERYNGNQRLRGGDFVADVAADHLQEAERLMATFGLDGVVLVSPMDLTAQDWAFVEAFREVDLETLGGDFSMVSVPHLSVGAVVRSGRRTS